jgi:hypothetical protein
MCVSPPPPICVLKVVGTYNIVIWVMDGKILACTVIVFSPKGVCSMGMMH